MSLTVERVAVAALTAYDRNPRSISKRAYERLLVNVAGDPEMLEARPIIATRGCEWTPDGTVIAGNMRLRAAVELGWESIPAVYVQLTEARAREWMLRDNVPFGDWDDDLLAEHLHEHQSAGADMDLTGFDPREWARLVDGVSGTTRDGIDDVPEPPKVPRSIPGEIYELGDHRLLCGPVDVDGLARLFGAERASIVVTSPPYNQQLDTFKASGMQRENPAWVERMASAYSDSMPEPEYQASQVAMLDALLTVTTANASVFYNHKHRYRAKVVVSPTEWIARAQWQIRQEIVWDRGGSITLNARMFMPVDERIYWLTRGGKFLFNDTTEVKTWGTVWSIAPHAEVKVSAPFPVEIPRRCIAAASRRGDVVLDPYGGSGTTLIAAHDLDRRAFLVEIDPGYCDVIRDRYAAHVEGT